MTALVLDAGALIAIDRDDRAMAARLRAALDAGIGLRTHAMVIAQAWRDPLGRQVNLARLLRAVDIVDIDEALAKAAGILCGTTGTSDPIDSAVALIANPGDTILTSDLDDLSLLVRGRGVSATVIAV